MVWLCFTGPQTIYCKDINWKGKKWVGKVSMSLLLPFQLIARPCRQYLFFLVSQPSTVSVRDRLSITVPRQLLSPADSITYSHGTAGCFQGDERRQACYPASREEAECTPCHCIVLFCVLRMGDLLFLNCIPIADLWANCILPMNQPSSLIAFNWMQSYFCKLIISYFLEDSNVSSFSMRL